MAGRRKQVVVPAALSRGDRVRIVAPSGAFDRDHFASGIALIEGAELVPVYDDEIFSRHYYLAGDDQRRAGELEAAVADESAKAIWCARGGYGATRILPRIDRTLLRASPRWLVGFSDATALHCLWQSQGLVSLHGPNVTTLAGWSAGAREALWSWLFTGTALPLRGQVVAGGGIVHGALCGGNLTVLAAMAAGPYMPSLRDAILLIEDVGERPYRLDRALTTLDQADWLHGVAGVAIGQLTACDEPQAHDPDYDALTVVCDRLGDLLPGVPVVAEIPIGHEPSSQPVPLGHGVTLDADAGILEVDPLPRGH